MHSRPLFAVTLMAALVAGLTFRAAPSAGADEFVVKFRLTKWKSAHFHDAKAAKTFNETMTKLGCEAKQHAHGDHIDVTFRCAQWRALSATSDEHAHQWESWLKKYGFETSHQH